MSKHKRKQLEKPTTLSKKDLSADQWVSQSEAARIRGVTPQAIENLMKKGRFRTLRIGGRVLLDRREVENYKAQRTGRPRKRIHSRK
jgi:excisionase family DNA binding protein